MSLEHVFRAEADGVDIPSAFRSPVKENPDKRASAPPCIPRVQQHALHNPHLSTPVRTLILVDNLNENKEALNTMLDNIKCSKAKVLLR